MGKGIERKLPVVVIVHGKSELKICQNIASHLKMPQEVYSRVNGKSSIQVAGLMSVLNSVPFKSKSAFKQQYPLAFEKGYSLHDAFKIFPIMDVDDCTEQQKKDYKSGSLFKQHWLSDYIVPIWNDPHLEKAMKDCGILITDKKQYEKKFPIVKKGRANPENVREFLMLLKKCKQSNMDTYVEFCLKHWAENLKQRH